MDNIKDEYDDGETPYEEWTCENCLALIDAELWECSCSRRWSWSDVPSVVRHCADCAPNTFPKLFYVKNQNGVENTYWKIDGQILYEDKNWKFTAPSKPSEAAQIICMRKCPRCP